MRACAYILQQGTASEATCVMLLAARQRALRRLKAERPDANDHELFGKMVTYSSDQVQILFSETLTCKFAMFGGHVSN